MGSSTSTTSCPAAVPPSQQPHGGGLCTSDWNCSLGGECSYGICKCDPWFTGKNCALLNLAPASSLDQGLQLPGYRTWCGHCVHDPEANRFVGLFSVMVGHCSLWAWGTASGIVIAEANKSEGPYRLLDAKRGGQTDTLEDAIVIPPYAHNAYVAFDPTEKLYLLFHIGEANTPRKHWCNQSGGDISQRTWAGRAVLPTTSITTTTTMFSVSLGGPVDESMRLNTSTTSATTFPTTTVTTSTTTDPRPAWAEAPGGISDVPFDFIGVSVAKSPSGPWSETRRIELFNQSNNDWVTGYFSNPAPFIFKNGTTLLYGKCRTCPKGWGKAPECICLFRASNWKGPYKLLSASEPLINLEGEDPAVFQDPRGNFHLLSNINTWHARCLPGEAGGGHAWSRDGLTWSEVHLGAFGPLVELANGSSLHAAYTERPAVYQDPETGVPTTFFVGLSGDNYHGAINWAQPFVTRASETRPTASRLYTAWMHSFQHGEESSSCKALIIACAFAWLLPIMACAIHLRAKMRKYNRDHVAVHGVVEQEDRLLEYGSSRQPLGG